MNSKKKFIIAGFYTLGIFAATPFLPQLISFARSQWSREITKRLVLGTELFIAVGLIAFGAFLFKYKKSKMLLVSILLIFFLSVGIYQILPNPYEFTHLPEYGVLSWLLVWAFYRKKEINGLKKEDLNRRGQIKSNGRGIWKSKFIKNYYFYSISLTAVVGAVDEIYQYFLPRRSFRLYDIFLNLLGGLLGLLVFWGYNTLKNGKKINV